jgi:hypothetical protein
MNNEMDNLRENGPTTAILGYACGKKDEYSVGDKIHGNTVIAKTKTGDRVCIDRSIRACTACLASGWAIKLGCEVPLTGI